MELIATLAAALAGSLVLPCAGSARLADIAGRHAAHLQPAPPADPHARQDVVKLLHRLQTVSRSEAFIFGHHNTNSQGQTWSDETGALRRSDVASATGVYPGMYGYNLAGVHAEGKANYSGLVKAMQAQAKGAVLHMFWEAGNPVTGGSANDLAGSPITEILPGGRANSRWVQWMDRVADFFLEIDIPAIFRPFHENTGAFDPRPAGQHRTRRAPSRDINAGARSASAQVRGSGGARARRRLSSTVRRGTTLQTTSSRHAAFTAFFLRACSVEHIWRLCMVSLYVKYLLVCTHMVINVYYTVQVCTEQAYPDSRSVGSGVWRQRKLHVPRG